MNEASYISTVLFFATALNLFLAIGAAIRASSKAAHTYALMMVAAAFYTFGSACEIRSQTLGDMLYWIRIQYIGIATIPAFMFAVAAQFSGRTRWLSRPVILLLAALSATTLVLIFTNDYHHLYYSSTAVSTAGPFPVLSVTPGIWYYVNVAYINSAILLGFMFILMTYSNSSAHYRKQALLMIIASIFPWLGHLVYLTGLSPWGIDTSPLAFTMSGLFFALGLLRYRLFHLLPVARDSVFESMREGVIVLDRKNIIVDFNPAAKEIFNNLPSGIMENICSVLADYPDLREQILTNSEQARIEIARGDSVNYYNSSLIPVIDKKGQVLGKTIILNDVTQMILLMENLRHFSSVDDLTQIYNRRHFMELCKKELDRVRRYKHAVSLIIFDIDHFKQINDSYGHEAGDLVLKMVAKKSAASLRASDILGRYGGEEFAVLLPETSVQEACRVAERLREKIAGYKVPCSNERVSVTASFGVTGASAGQNFRLKNLIRKADEALYQAKADGRNCVRLFPLNI